MTSQRRYRYVPYMTKLMVSLEKGIHSTDTTALAPRFLPEGTSIAPRFLPDGVETDAWDVSTNPLWMLQQLQSLGVRTDLGPRSFCCDCAERALHQAPLPRGALDPKIRAAVKTARLYLAGKASSGKLAAAHENLEKASDAVVESCRHLASRAKVDDAPLVYMVDGLPETHLHAWLVYPIRSRITPLTAADELVLAKRVRALFRIALACTAPRPGRGEVLVAAWTSAWISGSKTALRQEQIWQCERLRHYVPELPAQK